MTKQNVLMIASTVLIILGIIMIFLGTTASPKIAVPPVITGIGFFVISLVFIKIRN